MKKTIIFCGFVLMFGVLILSSCNKESALNSKDVPFLGGDTFSFYASIDQWISDSLNKPYNMQVKYRFDESEAAVNNLTPIKEQIVLPALKNIKTVWIDTYLAEAGGSFLKPLIPKLITMVGSPSYNSNGSVTLGEAEGGLAIILYDMNTYDPINNRSGFIQKMHTIHHEFGHILHQHKYYSPVFQTICAGDYTGNWALTTMADANALGFVTPYSRSAPDEDFVETISTMLVEGKDSFENLKNTQIKLGNPSAAAKLTQKEQIIVAYYKDNWGINFYSLQERVRLAIASVSAPTFLVANWWGGNASNKFSTAKADSTMLKTMSNGSAKDSINKVITLLTSVAPRLDSINLIFTAPDTLLLRTRSGPKTPLSTYYLADYRFKVTTSSTGVLTLGPVIINAARDGNNGANAAGLQTQFAPLTNFLTKSGANLRWAPGSPVLLFYSNLTSQVIQFVSKSDAQAYFTGRLAQ